MATTMKDTWQAAAHHLRQNRPLLPMYAHLLFAALLPIYTGAHASLSRPSSAAKADKTSKDGDEEDEEETMQKMEALSPQDAIIFPLTAGAALTALYFAIKTYGADMVNVLVGGYFSLIGTYSVAKLINDAWSTLESFLLPTYYRDQGVIWKVSASDRKVVAFDADHSSLPPRSSPLGGPLGRWSLPKPLSSLIWAFRDISKKKYAVSGYAQGIFDFRAILTRHNAISAVLGTAAITFHIFVSKPWWLTNLQGFAVSYGSLQLMSPTSFATGTLLLTGLFFYDIWAVFGTPMMVTVAKNLDVPIKLVFPRPEEPSATPGEPPVRNYSMLGLGDIVLPGLLIALALRFDLYMFYLRKQKQVAKDNGAKDGVQKAPYVSATGHWGDRAWVSGHASTRTTVPAFLTTTFPKPYFFATMIGYIIGMVATIGFMAVFQHAQPALLYLVPAVLISLWGTGAARGELNHLWEFSEVINGESLGEETEATVQEAANNSATGSTPIWSTIWNWIFGNENNKQNQDTPEESSATTQGSEGSQADQQPEEVCSTDDKSVIFSFAIALHKPGPSADSADRDPAKTEEQHSRIESATEDDAVFVSSADLDNARNAKARHRAGGNQIRVAEKRARLK